MKFIQYIQCIQTDSTLVEILEDNTIFEQMIPADLLDTEMRTMTWRVDRIRMGRQSKSKNLP
jgi:hypothetical protein